MTCMFVASCVSGAATEPLRGEFPSFVRSADASSATATLEILGLKPGPWKVTPPKTNMEPENDGLEDDFPFQLGDF